ncbi:MAG: hypothetical protein LBL82_05025 [Oscillospiraceae bacterium]|nr:hypothetical protein [Oscillospiraceae bacterium]
MDGVKGRLHTKGKNGGVQFFTEDYQPFPVSGVRTDGNEVRIYTLATYNALLNFSDSYILYCTEGNCFIYDDEGNKLPDFKLYLEDDKDCSPYIRCGEISQFYSIDRFVEGHNFSADKEITFTPFITCANVIKPRVLNRRRAYPADNAVLMRFTFFSHHDTKLALSIGASGDVQIWCNNKDLGYMKSEEKLLLRKVLIDTDFHSGKNEVVIWFANRLIGRGDKGVSLKLKIPPKTDGVLPTEFPMVVRRDDAKLFLNT